MTTLTEADVETSALEWLKGPSVGASPTVQTSLG